MIVSSQHNHKAAQKQAGLIAPSVGMLEFYLDFLP